MTTNEIPRGPEDLPLQRYFAELWIMVTLVDIKSNRKIRTEKINYGNFDARKWLGKVTLYSVTNGYAVITCAEGDYVVEE